MAGGNGEVAPIPAIRSPIRYCRGSPKRRI